MKNHYLSTKKRLFVLSRKFWNKKRWSQLNATFRRLANNKPDGKKNKKLMIQRLVTPICR